ncbi:unnamed protein product [Rotaria sordida]|uniref:RING-type domain-containing protein n=1 Tax=Rotaria sordida TaxID=392033 RepID=A0A814B498_9BILA|nr:unnamed protein product [Rotaria sordida]CAF0873622.1 unnamed protein product [Rotaria sordida]CAF0920808.1 unnamed protein product [Rotaria sordida]CAF0947586.1 unnamed protein product [Rotaria sordida]CAF0951486.1 unnamed protein product [Rotaria sordida]
MTDEYNTSTDLNMATGEEDTEEAIVTNKDEPMTTTIDENGYESECSSSSRSEEDVACSALEIEADAFTRFIERQRMEVMFELRRLRLGERPVTGQHNRERIETFLNNIHEHQQETRVPSTRPAPPSAHIADINALTNRRCVSAALGSAAFRQDLENTIRNTIGTRPVVPVQQTPRTSSVPQVLASVNVEQQRPQIIPTVPQIPIEQQSSRTPSNVERQQREFEAWDAITQLQRERIVLEISDLVHRQLVTSALESDFRRHLEQNVLNRLEHGAPAEQQQQAAPTAIIPPVPTQLPRVNVHASASNIDALSARLDTMQQMLQLVFTMQMDMQRSLRQDVASALANNSTTTMNSTTQPIQSGHCTVCLNAIADTVLYRCGHLCVCYVCGLQLQQGRTTHAVKCPICRAPVEDILRVYRSSRDGE